LSPGLAKTPCLRVNIYGEPGAYRKAHAGSARGGRKPRGATTPRVEATHRNWSSPSAMRRNYHVAPQRKRSLDAPGTIARSAMLRPRPPPAIRVVAVGMILSCGCVPIPSEYVCADDSQCVHDGVRGVCEATTRFCSFPDPACAGWERRYGEL